MHVIVNIKYNMEQNKYKAANVVDFENVNQIKKKAVRGLLKKRAKRYECKYIVIWHV